MRRIATPDPAPGGRRRRRRVPLTVFSALLLLLAGALGLTVSGGSAAAAVPPPPSGWTTVFSDDFNGAAGSGLNRADWLYDTGTGYNYPGAAGNWGTGELETATDSTANVYQDGSGHLVIKPIKDALGALDVGPDRDPAHRLRRPGGRAVGDQRLPPAAQPGRAGSAIGRRSGPWAPPPARSARPTGPASASWTSWRTSTR